MLDRVGHWNLLLQGHVKMYSAPGSAAVLLSCSIESRFVCSKDSKLAGVGATSIRFNFQLALSLSHFAFF